MSIGLFQCSMMPGTWPMPTTPTTTDGTWPTNHTNHMKHQQHCKKGMLYIEQCPVRRSAQSALHFSPRQTCPFRHQLDFSEKHSSHAAITSEDYSFTFPKPSIARYSCIQLSGLERTKMPKLWNGSKGGSNPGSFDCESGILPLSYRALQW